MPSVETKSAQPAIDTGVATKPTASVTSTTAIAPHVSGSKGDIEIIESPPEVKIDSSFATLSVKDGKKPGHGDVEEDVERFDDLIHLDEEADEVVISPSGSSQSLSARFIYTMKGDAQGSDGRGTPELLFESRPLSAGSSGDTSMVRTPPLRHRAPPSAFKGTRQKKKKHHSRLVPQAPQVKKPKLEAEIIVDPYKYLIKLDHNPNSKKFDLTPYSASVQTYLRILGRSPAMEAIQSTVETSKYAAALFAGGLSILKRAKASQDGEFPLGIFFDPTKITKDALRKYPNMPWLYDSGWDDIEQSIIAGVSMEGVKDEAPWPQYVESYLFSPYVRPSRGLVISNAIVPLPERGMDPTDPRWEALILSCYSETHPILVLGNHPYCNIDNENLIMAIRDYEISPYLLELGKRNTGLSPDRDVALDAYMRNVMDIDPDSGSESE